MIIIILSKYTNYLNNVSNKKIINHENETAKAINIITRRKYVESPFVCYVWRLRLNIKCRQWLTYAFLSESTLLLWNSHFSFRNIQYWKALFFFGSQNNIVIKCSDYVFLVNCQFIKSVVGLLMCPVFDINTRKVFAGW